MGYYHIRLIENLINLCTIILPCERYSYKCLSMVFANFPDIFQHNMNDLFHGSKFIRAYIYDILILGKRDWKDHVQKLELTLNNLKGKGLKCNIERYFFGQIEMKYLGFWVRLDGVKP